MEPRLIGSSQDGVDMMFAVKARDFINVACLDLLSLRLALTCARVGSMTRAAALCDMQLFNASQRLTRLEGDLGVSVFYRQRKGMEPTDAGRAVPRGKRYVTMKQQTLAMDNQSIIPRISFVRMTLDYGKPFKMGPPHAC